MNNLVPLIRDILETHMRSLGAVSKAQEPIFQDAAEVRKEASGCNTRTSGANHVAGVVPGPRSDSISTRVCRACGWKFVPEGREHVCHSCVIAFKYGGIE